MSQRDLRNGKDRLLRAVEVARNRVEGLIRAPSATGHILMLHTGRSGSTVVGNLLQQHSQIYWDGEIYEKMFMRIRAEKGVLIRDQDELLGPDDAWPEVDRRRKRGGPKLYGYECRDSHLRRLKTSLPDYLRAARSRGFTRVILLERRNLLLKILSSVVAETRGQHHVRAGSLVAQPSLYINLDQVPLDHERVEILTALTRTALWLKDAEAAAGSDHLHLCYEDSIQNDPLVAYGMACEFLGVRSEKPSINLGKTTAFPLHQIVKNFDELCDRLRSTEFEWMTLG